MRVNSFKEIRSLMGCSKCTRFSHCDWSESQHGIAKCAADNIMDVMLLLNITLDHSKYSLSEEFFEFIEKWCE